MQLPKQVNDPEQLRTVLVKVDEGREQVLVENCPRGIYCALRGRACGGLSKPFGRLEGGHG